MTVVDFKLMTSKGFPVAVVKLKEKMEIFSSAVLNHGHMISDTLMIMEVPKRYDSTDPLGDIEKVRIDLELPKETVGFMTAAEIEYVTSLKGTDFEGMQTFAVVTAGLGNKVIAGDLIFDMEERLIRSAEKEIEIRKKKKIGTINIIGISPMPLTDAAKINSFIVMTEAKTAAMQSLGHKETGTTSDAIAVVSPVKGERKMYCGTGTPLGISLARSVKEAVRDSLIKRDDLPEAGTFLDQLLKFGITEENMWDAAMELYVPNPDWNIETLKKMFLSLLQTYAKDINASSLIQGAMELEHLGDKDLICSMPKGMFASDPVHLIADEILGMQLAQYISGTRGVFEFHRFDRHKPGIIGKLGPFMDDIICGLVGGIMSSVYTKLFDGDVR
ncbi:MAG: phosphatidylglycerophosphatase A [Methanomassiliicoccaceae archaeon]|nr:phosphatidylglycerophosphatase A [Methanomassiliicoccaceae archaeon]